jgi:hypothetical protein
MTMKVRQGGSWQTITAGKAYVGGAWRSLVAIKIFASGAWRTVANFTPPSGGGGGTGGGGGGGTGGGGTLSLSASPSSLYTTSFSSSMTSDPCTITPSGGLAPYTYAWTMIAGTAGITSPTFATTTFTKTTSGIANVTARCTVTDSLHVTASVDVPMTFERQGL